jgi:glycosyltransferase involved in cell wall biosynthesis
MTNRWICCQIGAREHYAIPRALNKYHLLDSLLTDAWVPPENLVGLLRPGLYSRFHPALAAANVYAPTARSIAFELHAKLSGLSNWSLTIARNEWFQKIAVKKLSRVEAAAKSRTVMAYSYAALEIFKLARTRGWRTVLGQIDPGCAEERIVARIYEQDLNQRGLWRAAPPQYWSRWRNECALADRIIVNSLWAHNALLQVGVAAKKIKVIPLAYDEPQTIEIKREYPKSFSESRPLRVLFLGQINLRKGFGPLLDAIDLLRGEPIDFLFVGPIQISIPSNLRSDPRVHWVGSVPQEKTAQFYRYADVFIFPTLSDGFGITQLEAQAWKLPIITTNFCGNVIEHGKNGYILSEVTSYAIAAILRRCLADPARLGEMAANSAISEQFSLSRVGEQWLHAFD